MRVTSSSMLLNTIANLRASQNTVANAQAEAITGKRLRTLSDDPTDAAQVMRLNSEVRDLDQYVRNGSSANVRLTTEDTVITSLRGAMDTARKIAIGISSDDPTSSDRQNALQTVNNLIDQVVSLGNTRVGGEYIFGGTQIGSAPFANDGTYLGSTTPRTIGLDQSVTMTVNHTGDQLFGPALAALKDLANRLATGTAAQVQAVQPGLVAATDSALGAQALNGARLQQVKDSSTDLAARSASLLDLRDKLQLADPAESAVRLTAAQTALERAYAVVGKVFSTSLVDFLK